MANTFVQTFSFGGIQLYEWRISNSGTSEVLKGIGPGKTVLGCTHCWDQVISADNPKYLVDEATGEITASAIASGSYGRISAFVK